MNGLFLIAQLEPGNAAITVSERRIETPDAEPQAIHLLAS